MCRARAALNWAHRNSAVDRSSDTECRDGLDVNTVQLLLQDGSGRLDVRLHFVGPPTGAALAVRPGHALALFGVTLAQPEDSMSGDARPPAAWHEVRACPVRSWHPLKKEKAEKQMQLAPVAAVHCIWRAAAFLLRSCTAEDASSCTAMR